MKGYTFSIFILLSVLAGAAIGLTFKENAAALKPAGDLFLNLLFTAVVPLVFFSISSAVAGMKNPGTMGKILAWMLLIFILTGIVSSILMITAVKIFPPELSNLPVMESTDGDQPAPFFALIVKAFTVSDFSDLLSKKNILPLIVFSFLFGLAACSLKEKAQALVHFLQAGQEVMLKVIFYIMKLAPLGLGAYFAYFTGTYGSDILGAYLGAIAVYYPVAVLYYFFGFSFYAFLAAGLNGIRNFWSNIATLSLTALATGSSLAAIPANLEAADKIGVPREISRLVIPIGATIHMDGTCLSAILKTAILFHLYQWDFSGFGTFAAAVGIALLSGIVMSGIPGGGFLGEMMIVTLYGFPPEALPLISIVGILVDPPATMVNSTGDTVASMMIQRLTASHRTPSGGDGLATCKR